MSAGDANKQATRKRPRRGRRRFRPPKVALAVLRKARETAAAAAQAAADATALIQQGRIGQHAHFDALHGLMPLLPPPSLQPFRRGRRGRRRGRGRRTDTVAEKSGTSRTDVEPQKTSRQRKSASYWARRRERQRRRRAEAVGDPYSYDPPPVEPYSFPPDPYPPVVDDYPGMMGYRGYQWQDLGAGPDPGFIPPSDRFAVPGPVRYAPSRNDEYLAQARALIQAQNEQMHPGYHAPYEPWQCPAPYMPEENWGPRSHMRSSRW